jgi:DNA-binding NarL/FixJ family response regulator
VTTTTSTTGRQCDALDLLARGYDNATIARRMVLSARRRCSR